MIETYIPQRPPTSDRLRAVLWEEFGNRQGPDLTPHLELLEALITLLERRSAPRTCLPRKLCRFPFTWSRRLQALFLRLFNFLFADQREINNLLAKALRQQVGLLRTLDARRLTAGTSADC